MTTYVTNVNTYLSQMKIKRTYLCSKSGIEENELSRILTGDQDITSADMEKIAKALGKKTEYFLSEQFEVPEKEALFAAEFAFYAGEPSEKQVKFAKQLIELIENVDEVLGAKGRYFMTM